MKHVRPWHWILAGLMLAACGFTAYRGYQFYDSFQEHVGKDLTSCSGAPSGATHIFFHGDFCSDCMAFDIDERDFVAWVADRGFTDRKGGFPLDGSVVDFRIDQELTITAKITDGIIIVNRDPKGGGGYTVRYDRKTGRAYYDWSMN